MYCTQYRNVESDRNEPLDRLLCVRTVEQQLQQNGPPGVVHRGRRECMAVMRATCYTQTASNNDYNHTIGHGASVVASSSAPSAEACAVQVFFFGLRPVPEDGNPVIQRATL